ncbi:hypothetical protein AGMMS49593_06050 [Endomicrobiia bacterium]|nr:hypothetical protein AGMMS49593_06050 [Endomicrobiia bacterium]
MVDVVFAVNLKRNEEQKHGKQYQYEETNLLIDVVIFVTLKLFNKIMYNEQAYW